MNPRIRVRVVDALGSEWTPILATSRRTRRRGLRPHPTGRSMIFSGRSVHSVGMHARIGVIAIDRTGRVVGTTCLYPNRLVLFAKASLILEVPWCSRLPKLGAQLVAETKRVDRTDIEANKVCKGHDGEGRTAGRC